MTRDYKSSRRTTSKKRRRTGTRNRNATGIPGWMWLFCGLLIGMGIAVAAYFYMQAQTETLAEKKSAPANVKKATPAPTKKETTIIEKTRFEFYTLLPKMEVVIPDSVIEEARLALPKAEFNLAYILQTGSFRNAKDADTMKARLALLGMEANIETVVIGNKNTWNRVRLGPFPDMQSLRPVRRQLKQNNIEFILLKMKI